MAGGWEWAGSRPEMSGAGPMTVAAWLVFYDNEPQGWFATSRGQGGSGTKKYGYGGAGQNTRRLRFVARFTSTNGTWDTPASHAIEIGQWHHCAITYDLQDDVNIMPSLYIDGLSQPVEVRAAPVGTADNIDSISGLNVGGNNKGVVFDGQICDFALWRGEFLTPADISALGTGRLRPGEIRPDNLVSWVDCASGIDVIRPDLVAVAGATGVAPIGTIPPALLNWER